MNILVPPSYKGPTLATEAESLFAILGKHGFTCDSTGSADKTLNVYFNGVRCAYWNSTVVRLGVVGYHFAAWGRRANDCPKEFAATLAEEFQRRYRCESDDIEVQFGTGSNSGRKYLIITNPTVALRVICQDAGVSFGDDTHVALREGKYVEGNVREVLLRSLERSPAARQRCLETHGFNCGVCCVNIKERYGLDRELIHVHHERPLSAVAGPRETDPVKELKPLCPNCHAVVHSRSPPFTLEEVRKMLRGDT